MTNFGLIHYYLGMEVWQEDGHAFLGKVKYATDVQKRFQMTDCRPMSTPMITNWAKLHASKGELVDPTLYCQLYRQLIGSLMYLVNTRPYMSFVLNNLR